MIEIFNPIAECVEQRHRPADRLDGIDGKRIALFWNMKPGGDAALAEVERILGERYPRAVFKRYSGDVGSLVKHLTYGAADAIAAECDAVIGTTGD